MLLGENHTKQGSATTTTTTKTDKIGKVLYDKGTAHEYYLSWLSIKSEVKWKVSNIKKEKLVMPRLRSLIYLSLQPNKLAT